MGELRERKKRETRERISDVATMLFVERGFDAVTVDEIAAAAGVSTVTVFNYFGKKEELFFDRGDQDYVLAKDALADRAPGVSPLRALQTLVHGLVKEAHPLVAFDEHTIAFWRTVKESTLLRARARELRGEFERALAAMLAEHAGPKDASPRLAAAMLTAAWCVSFTTALRKRAAGATDAASRKLFRAGLDDAFAILERGMTGSTLV